MMNVVAADDGKFDEFMVALRKTLDDPGRRAIVASQRTQTRQCTYWTRNRRKMVHNDLVPQPVNHAGSGAVTPWMAVPSSRNPLAAMVGGGQLAG